MQSFREGSQEVKFNDQDLVIKLDSHRFYKYVSGRGYKGVDFLVINEELGLVLIELKNYVHNSSPNKIDLEKVFFQKCEDTLHLIEIINKFYQKKWWIKFFVNQLHMTFLLSAEGKFWIKAFQLYQESKVLLIGNFEMNEL